MSSLKNKSNEFPKEDNEVISLYFFYKENGQFQQAYEVLQPLETKHPDNFMILFLLGISLYESEEFKKSIPYLKKSIGLRPADYLSSLTLIHSLSNDNRWNSAFKELRRFLMQKKNTKEHVLFLKLLDKGKSSFGTPEKDTIQKLMKEFKIKT